MPRPVGDASYREVRGLARGLQVLQALNHAAGGKMRPTDVSAITGLHRTTVRRLLETLAASGMVRRSASDDSFRLALGVRTLSEGFTDDAWISQAAMQAMGGLVQEVGWPTDLCTPDGGRMIVRESTHRFSRFSFHRAMVGTRLPMLYTAAGRAYFAFCSAQEREKILRFLRDEDEELQVLARSPRRLAALIRKIRADGYASNDREWSREPRFSAIALPVHSGAALLGSLNMVFAARSMSVQEAAERHLPAMRRAVARIASAMDVPEPKASSLQLDQGEGPPAISYGSSEGPPAPRGSRGR